MKTQYYELNTGIINYSIEYVNQLCRRKELCEEMGGGLISISNF